MCVTMLRWRFWWKPLDADALEHYAPTPGAEVLLLSVFPPVFQGCLTITLVTVARMPPAPCSWVQMTCSCQDAFQDCAAAPRRLMSNHLPTAWCCLDARVQVPVRCQVKLALALYLPLIPKHSVHCLSASAWLLLLGSITSHLPVRHSLHQTHLFVFFPCPDAINCWYTLIHPFFPTSSLLSMHTPLISPVPFISWQWVTKLFQELWNIQLLSGFFAIIQYIHIYWKPFFRFLRAYQPSGLYGCATLQGSHMKAESTGEHYRCYRSIYTSIL